MNIYSLKERIKKSNKSILLLIVLVVVVDGLYLLIKHPGSIDEVTSIAVPAYFAGLDWSDLCTLKLKWHGYGATILILPFMFLFGNNNIYLLCLIECLLFRIILTVLTYVISERYLLLDSKKSMLIAMACNFGVLSADNGKRLSAMTEIPIALIMLVIIYLLLWGMTEKRVASTVWITLLLAYTSTIHSRVLICVGAIVVAVVICRWKYKRWIISAPVAIITAGVSVLIIDVINGVIKDKVYSFSGGEANFVNSTNEIFASSASKLQLLLDFEYIKLFIEEFLSLCGSYTYYTFGMIWIITVINFGYIVKCLMRERSGEVDSVFMIALIGMISFWGMNIALSIKCITLFSVNYYQILTYVRYAMPFTWLMAFAALVIVIKGKVNRKKVSIYAAILLVLCGKYFISVPFARLEESGMGLNKSFFQSVFWNGESAREYFDKMFLISIVAFVIMVFAWKSSYKKLICCYVVISMCYITSVFAYCLKNEFANNLRVDKCNEVLQIIREERSETPIYYYSKDNLFYMYLIFDNTDLNMYYAKGVEKLDLNNSMYITSVKDKKVEAEFVISLDGAGYVYTSNEEIYECIAKESE